MNEISVTQSNLPTNIDDLAKFVLVGEEKLHAVWAEIRAIKKLQLADAVLAQKQTEANELSKMVICAQMRIGEMTAAMPKKQGTRSDITSPEIREKLPTKADALKSAGISDKRASEYERMASHPEIVEKAIAEATDNGDVVSRADILKRIKAQKKAEDIEQAREKIAAQQTDTGKTLLYVGNGIGRTLKHKCDLLLTDPPYSTDVDDIDAFVDSWLYKALEGVKDTGFAYVFTGAYPDELRAYLAARTPPHMTLEQVLVWTYKNTLGQNPKDRYKQNWQACLFYRGKDAPPLDCPLTNEQWSVQEINAPDGRQGDRYHAWQKPMEIAERFIRHSTKPGDIVFDPFACTGTFLLAAAKLGRKGIGFEIDHENARIAFERGCRRGVEG